MAAINGQFWTQTFLKTSGVPYAGCRVFHWAAGSDTTVLNIFSDAAMTSPLSNPFDGDNSGRLTFYGSGSYHFIVRSSIADGNLLLADWDGVELVHHTATLRAEDRGTSNPSITAAHRGRFFAITDAGGDLTSIKIVKSASAFLDFVTLPQLGQMLEFKKGADLASTTSVTLGSDGNLFDITGINSIEEFSAATAKQAGAVFWTRFTGGGLNLIYSASKFILPWGLDYRVIPNEIVCWKSLGSGNYVFLGSNGPRARIGDIVMQAGAAVPTGFLPCDGAAISRATYSGLFAEIGTAYGIGDGLTTFNVPDLRGRVPIGTGIGSGGGASGSGVPTGGVALTARARGDWAGDERRPQHSHGVTDPGHTHSREGGSVVLNPNPTKPSVFVDAQDSVSLTNTGTNTTGLTVNDDGSGQSQNIQPVTVVPFNIRF